MSTSRAISRSPSPLSDQFDQVPDLPATVIGIGVDIVDTERFALIMGRTPRIIDRLFTSAEAEHKDGTLRTPVSLAARFAAKEAVAKVLGDTAGLEWHDCRVLTDELGKPYLHMVQTLARASSDLGIVRWHLSLSHDAGHSIAFVVAEGAHHPRGNHSGGIHA